MCVLIFLNDPRWKKLQGNWKKTKSDRNWSKNRVKTEEKQSSARFRRLKKTSAKWAFCCQTIPQHFGSLCENFRSCEGEFGTRVPLCSTWAPISQLWNALRRGKAWFAPKVLFRRVFRNCESDFGTRVPLRNTVTLISQLRNALRSCCEIGVLLRNSNWPLVFRYSYLYRSFELRKGFQN